MRGHNFLKENKCFSAFGFDENFSKMERIFFIRSTG